MRIALVLFAFCSACSCVSLRREYSLAVNQLIVPNGNNIVESSTNYNQLYSLIPKELILGSLLEQLGLNEYFYVSDDAIRKVPIPRNVLSMFILSRSLPKNWHTLIQFLKMALPFGLPNKVDVVELSLVVPTALIYDSLVRQLSTVVGNHTPLYEMALNNWPLLVTSLKENSEDGSTTGTTAGTTASSSSSLFNMFARNMITNDQLTRAIFCEYPFFCIQIPNPKYICLSSPWNSSTKYLSSLTNWVKQNVYESFERSNNLFIPLRILQDGEGNPRHQKFSQVIFNSKPYSYLTSKNWDKRNEENDNKSCIPITWYNIFHHSIFGDTNFCT